MSTEARDKAWEAYYRRPEHDGENVGHTGAAFVAGWDARGQVTPDREAAIWAAMKAMIASAEIPTGVRPGIVAEEFTIREAVDLYDVAEVAYDAILALLNEKGNE